MSGGVPGRDLGAKPGRDAVLIQCFRYDVAARNLRIRRFPVRSCAYSPRIIVALGRLCLESPLCAVTLPDEW